LARVRMSSSFISIIRKERTSQIGTPEKPGREFFLAHDLTFQKICI
jgi:hypothetical protein